MKRVNPLRRSMRPACLTGYTLIEMIISLGAGAILVSGLASSIVVSTQAWSEDLSSRRQADCSAATRRIHDDLQFAMQFTERTARAATFTVPDRDGDGVKETIRYAWTGVAGDPLTVALNGTPPETLIADVQQFQFDWQSRTLLVPVVEIEPAVLFLSVGSGDPGQVVLTAQEQMKLTQLQENHVVVTASVFSSQSILQSLIDTSTVIYISGEIDLTTFPAWIAQSTVGIVCERAELCQLLGVSSGFTVIGWSQMQPVNWTHNILANTSPYIGICSGFQPVSVLLPPFSPDLRVLTVAGFNNLEVILAAAEAGADSATGAFTIPGRRVMMPMGRTGSDFATWSSVYRSVIIDQSVAWASGGGEDAPLDVRVMLVANSAPWPAGRERDRLFLLQSLGCRVDVVSPYLSSAQYDAALVGVDVVWICEYVSPTAPASILIQKPVGIVIEHPDWLGPTGFGAATEISQNDSISITSPNHPILSGFSLSDLQVSWESRQRWDSSGYPTGMDLLATPTGGSPTAAAVGVFETGATTHIGPAAGRRVWLSLGEMRSNDMAIGMQTLMVNVLNWAGDD